MMTIEQLPTAWEPTRETLQKYAHAVTALPRAGATADPRWAHVAMDLDESGFVTIPVPLDDGTDLVSRIDLVNHQIVISAGDTSESIDLTAGPSPKGVGERILAVSVAHGSDIDVDTERYADGGMQTYDRRHAEAFWGVASSVAEAFTAINESIEGEITGPHLWPHGFDIATEWYSPKVVEYAGTRASAQIGVGWYPAGEAYFYANPWPFEDSWADVELPGGAVWNTQGWYGAKLVVADINSDSGIETVVELGTVVHDTSRASLSS